MHIFKRKKGVIWRTHMSVVFCAKTLFRIQPLYKHKPIFHFNFVLFFKIYFLGLVFVKVLTHRSNQHTNLVNHTRCDQ